MQDQPNTQVTRRRFVKGASATAVGVAASAYVKPSLRFLGVPGAQAAVSAPPPPPPPQFPPFAGGTPGGWANPGASSAARKEWWDVPNDPHWPGATPNPYDHNTLFNSVFASNAATVAALGTTTMYGAATQGGGNDWIKKTARDVVAAYLNASYYGTNFPYSQAQIKQLWADAIASLPNTDALKDLHDDLDAANNGL